VKGLMRDMKERVYVLCWLAYLAKWIIVGYLWDVVRLAGFAYCCTPGADPERSIGRQRLEWQIWQCTQRAKIEWRMVDTAWGGISSLWGWYREVIRAERNLRQLVTTLRPVFAEFQLPANNLVEQKESLGRLLKLAEIGRAALADSERGAVERPRPKGNPWFPL
jgi:hypothetical protein